MINEKNKLYKARNVMSSSLVKTALAASLLLSGMTGVVGPIESSSGIFGENFLITQAEAAEVSYSNWITGSGQHSLILKADGTVWTAGRNNYGALGNGIGNNNLGEREFKKVSGIDDVSFVAAGESFNLVIKKDGTVWSWGYNSFGQLGDGTSSGTNSKGTPVPVVGIDNVVGVDGGNLHSLAVKKDGTVWAWGNNGNSQLGDGTTTNRSTPVQVPGLTDVIQVKASDSFSLALKKDGTVWAWGNNRYGFLGDGTTTNRKVPVQVTGLTDIKSIDTTFNHSLALKSDGTVWVWGLNNEGQLGNGIVTNGSTPNSRPFQVPGLTNIKEIMAQNLRSFALKNDGTLWGWGNNMNGELGDGTKVLQKTPVQTIGIGKIHSMGGGDRHTFVITEDLRTYTWGYNSYGQLGIGTASSVQSPTFIDIYLDESVKLNEDIAIATASVAKAEGSKLQADVDASSLLVNLLPDSTEKTNLTNRLNVVQKAIDDAKALAVQVETATTTVVKAEGSKLQADVTAARTLVNALPTGTEKTSLTNRLNVVQKAIDDAKALAVQVETATTAVVKAEGSKLQADVTAARTLVNALPTGTEKTSLTNRLNVVQKAIDDGQALANQIATATASVLKAESSMMQVDVTSALTLVNALPTSTEKTNLTARLYTVQEAIDLAKQIATATTSVIKAEGTKQQVDVDDSRSLVNALSASTEKTNLTNRLNTVQTEIDASNGVYTDMMTELANMKDYLLTGEGTKEDVLAMRDALNSIFDDSTTLLNGAHRANVAQYVQDVLDIIELLETIWEKIESGELAGVTDLVEQLPESDLKNDTEENLSDAIAYEYQLEEATKAVELAESTKQQVNVNNARLLVNELAKETDRNRLSSRIDVTQSEIDLANLTVATSSVVKAEKSKLQADLTAARTLVSALKSSKEKNSLITRLDTVQKAIDDAKALAEQIATATASVVKAEGSKLQVDVTVARSLVSALPTGIEKTNLTTRLDTAQKAIDDAKALSEQIATATASVVKAEGSKLQADVTAARTLVNALPTGAEKTNLTTRLDTVQGAITLADKIATATTSVVKAEGSKLQADLDASLLLVNSLPTGTEKTNLTNRLNVVQKAIDDAKALATQIAVATTAVLKAEGSKLQADVNSAKTLVNALPTGTDKTNLTNRLDTVQAEITLAEKIVTATASVTKAEDSKTQADVNASRSLVNNLPDGTEKTNLNNRLDVVQKAIEDAKALAERIALATAAVIKAEETKLDVDIQTARHFTEALPNSQVKTELLDRIAVVEKANNEEVLLKNAKEAVDNLDDNSTKAEVDSAKELVSLLPDSIEKNKLIDRITNIELVQKAISSVEQAERMQTNYNISLAEKAILLLPDGLKKTELAERITELKLTLEAESKVVSAETTKREPYLTEAYVSVNKLKDGLKKTQLMGRLQAVKDAIEIEAEKALLTEATSLVVLAELHQREPYLTDAKEKVSKLKDGPDKTALEARIQSVEDAIATGPEAPVVDPALLKAAEQQVTFAERYKRDPYFTRAQEAINKLPNSKERTELQARLDAVMN